MKTFTEFSKNKFGHGSNNSTSVEPKKKFSQSISRGMNRKTLGQVSDKERVDGTKNTRARGSSNIVDGLRGGMGTMKKLSFNQARDIASKYGIQMNKPNTKKDLGTTGITLWYKAPGQFFLIPSAKKYGH